MPEKSMRGGLKRSPAPVKVLTACDGFSRKTRLGIGPLSSLNDRPLPEWRPGRAGYYQCPMPGIRQEPSGR
ncbi:hypothetical protein AGR13a_Lc10056 [Agrobacterium genomosp. 13 str. CFBP 6927]|uniref:Transposase n=1 Tax=Agrobacterium genomosp. 13 str. CFBP 6927 TaxID=1183428 RepID=A0ABP2BJL0_9HYPH|nr:hypothetical protein AGR13a_Lc10056 [Agrobacterium genomosp. 13 str. CFBP 6927]